MPEYSHYLGEAVKTARIKQGLTQKQVTEDLHIDDRTLSNIERDLGNPRLEILYPMIRYLNVDPRDIFYPEMKRDTPSLRHLRVLIENCSEEEAEALIPVFYSIFNVFRSRGSSEVK